MKKNKLVKHDTYDHEYLLQILYSTKTIAIVGASANPLRPSHSVLQFLLGRGYDTYPVNPGLAGQKILGREVFSNLSDVPVTIDLVDVFRNSEAAAEVVDEALALPQKPKTIWMQLGVRHDEAAAKAEAAGLQVVMNRCPAIELR